MSLINDLIKNIQSIIDKPIYSILIILNIVIIEGILSLDNSAILATMILKMNKNDRKKAFKYGIIGAYLFRGLCLMFTTFLIKIKWLKLIGGFYLIYTGINFFILKQIKSRKNIIYNFYNNFWIKILYIELIDLSFSIDNIIAATAISNNLLLILLGVFIGILTMRIITKVFLKLIEKYPYIQNSAFLIIILLGIKIIIIHYENNYINNYYYRIIHNFFTEMTIYILTILLFIIPIIIKKINNYKL